MFLICLIIQKKADLENATGVDTLKFAKKIDLANLKSDIGKSDIDKLKNVTTNSNILKTKVGKLGTDKLYLFLLI